eukprot:TRINITY_DN5214_c0_g1_i1.p1 TRINITY_DN5214_c0_g1~~TRINITY_DN5214_c0_g1_i1.p1  ORF type:complete len:412 (+),score=62.83 TRINITY_DN5214_c0_g1_i1:81-1316(+)
MTKLPSAISGGKGNIVVKNTFLTYEECEEEDASAFSTRGFLARQLSDPTPMASGSASLNRFLEEEEEELSSSDAGGAPLNVLSSDEDQERLTDAPQRVSEILLPYEPHSESRPAPAIPQVSTPALWDAPATSDPDDAAWRNVTTVMVRNLPNKYTRQEFLQEVDRGFANTYDFIYLPIDQQNGANKGYAFMNFIAPSHAIAFRREFDGSKMALYNSSKVVNVAIAALQGFEANYNHYSKTRVGTGRKQARPLFLRKPAIENQSCTEPNQAARRSNPQRGLPLAAQVTSSSTSNASDHSQVRSLTSGSPHHLEYGRCFASEAPSFSPANASFQNQRQYCPECGELAHALHLFCKYCGGRLSPHLQEQESMSMGAFDPRILATSPHNRFWAQQASQQYGYASVPVLADHASGA